MQILWALHHAGALQNLGRGIMCSDISLLLPCRLCEPYITPELVHSTFGQQLGQEVADRFAGGCRHRQHGQQGGCRHSKHTKPTRVHAWQPQLRKQR